MVSPFSGGWQYWLSIALALADWAYTILHEPANPSN